MRRVLRRFELWPVAKVALFFHLFCYALTLATLTGAYFLADRAGSLKNLEQLMTRLGWEEFKVHGDVLFRGAATIGAALMVIATVATVTLAFFYNSLSSIFGGLVVSVLQEYAPGEAPLTRRARRRARRRAKKLAKQDRKNLAAQAKTNAKQAKKNGKRIAKGGLGAPQ